MKLLSLLLNLNPIKLDLKKKELKKTAHQLRFNRNHRIDQEQTEALIQTGRQQFKKLEELGLKIPIAVI